jgi:hypothetical protein
MAFALSVVLPALPLMAGGAASKNTAGAAAATTNALSALAPVEIPLSVFTISANPRECRNPFFPQSAVAAPLPVPKQNSSDFSSFILNGITSPPKRTAMINGSTFELGEEHEIKLPNGSKVMIKCEEIRADSAVISVGGVRRELHLRGGL